MSRSPDEMATKLDERLNIGGFSYCLRTSILRDKHGADVTLRGQSAEVLAHLAHNHGQIVSKTDLITSVWAETFVTDDSLVQCIADIRRLLGDVDKKIIQTFVKRGYQLNLSGAVTDAQDVEEIPRVAVMAFEDLSSGASRGYLGDAIAAGVITEISYFGEFSVVSRSSSFKYRDVDLGTGQIGAKLGAQYVIEGSQQIIGDTLRVSVQLIDARSEASLWSNSYACDKLDNFDVQFEIIRNIAAAIGFQVCVYAPSLLEPRFHGALYYFLASRVDVQHESPDSLKTAEVIVNKAIEADKNSPYGYIGLSYISAARYMHRWVAKDPDVVLRQAAEYADAALKLSPRNANAHFARGLGHLEAGELDQAERRFERSLALNPHAPSVQVNLAFLAFYRGETQDALRLMEQAMRSNPDHPEWFFASHAAMLRQNKEYNTALAAFRNMSSVLGSNHMQLAAIYVGLERQKEAEEAMITFLQRSPYHTVSRERAAEERKFIKMVDLDGWLDLIKRAGLPE